MTRQVVIRHPSSVNRRQPLLAASKSSSSSPALLSSSLSGGSGGGSMRIGEVAGGTAAECAAVCWCPCALVNILVLTVYKLPAGLCRKALQRKRRRKMMKKGLLPQRSSRCDCGCDDTELQIHPIAPDMLPAADKQFKSLQTDKDVLKMEKEMWDRFHSTGFWRSPFQRSNSQPSKE